MSAARVFELGGGEEEAAALLRREFRVPVRPGVVTATLALEDGVRMARLEDISYQGMRLILEPPDDPPDEGTRAHVYLHSRRGRSLRVAVVVRGAEGPAVGCEVLGQTPADLRELQAVVHEVQRVFIRSR